MNSNPTVTNDQLNPADFDKTIPEIAPKPQETEEISPELASADAIIDEYIRQCMAEVQKQEEKKEKIRQESSINVKEYPGSSRNVDERKQMSKNAGSMSKNVEKRTWTFSGELIRRVFRHSLIKQQDFAKEMGISRSKLSEFLKHSIFHVDLCKALAKKLGINTPEELQEYYDNIPEEVKESVRYDGRIYRPLKPGISIPPNIFDLAEQIGKLTEVINASKLRDAEKNNYYKVF